MSLDNILVWLIRVFCIIGLCVSLRMLYVSIKEAREDARKWEKRK